jgi:hypothetical protein
MFKANADGSGETFDDDTYQDRFAELTDAESADHVKNSPW